MDDLKQLLCESAIVSSKNFWKSIQIYLLKPHIVNRRLAGAELLSVLEHRNGDSSGADINALCDYLSKVLGNSVEKIPIVNILNEIHLENAFNVVDKEHLIEALTKSDVFKSCFVAINKLLPKNLKVHGISYELVVFGKL